MKKLLAVALVLVMCASLFAGCAPKAAEPAATPAAEPTKAPEKLKIGVAMSQFNDKWLSYMLDSMQEYSKGLTDVEVIYVDGKADVNTQLGQVETFIAQGCNAIVVNPVNTDATEPMTKAAKEAGVPLISVNRLFKNQDEATSYVGSESIKAGIMEMEYLAEKMGGKGNVAILVGDPGNEAAIKRTEGFKEVIKKYPDIKIVAEQIGMWQRDKGMSIMENWLQSDLKIDAVASNNDEMAIGALKAIEAAGKLGTILVGGVDATPDALEYMKAGKLNVTVFQDAAGQGVGAIKTAVAAAKGEKVEPIVWIPYELVKPEDVDKYIAKWQ